MKYKAFLFDLNGTMVDDMSYHLLAWHGILNELGASVSLTRVKEECYGKNHEVLERIFPQQFSREEKSILSSVKDKQYRQKFRANLQMINGLDGFLKAVRAAGIKTAIGSAATMCNIDFVRDGLDIRDYIDAVVSGDDVEQSKPDPQTWLECCRKLKVTADECLVFEDSPKGAESALNAGMDCIIITTFHLQKEFTAYRNVIGFINDFTDQQLKQLLF